MHARYIFLTASLVAAFFGAALLNGPSKKADGDSVGLSPPPVLEAEPSVDLDAQTERADRLDEVARTEIEGTVSPQETETPPNADEIWAKQLRPAGTEIDDPRELQLANLAILRQQFLESIERKESGSSIHQNGRILVHCAVAGILDSLGRFTAINPNGDSFETSSLDAAALSLRFNNRRYVINRGEFPVFDRFSDYTDSIRPHPSNPRGTSRRLPDLTEQDIADALHIADDSLGWLLR